MSHTFLQDFLGVEKHITRIARRTTVLANHCSEFIADPNARTGILEGNPIHKDMIWAGRRQSFRLFLML